jgi:membrane fusion protein, multidrug efflux system
MQPVLIKRISIAAFILIVIAIIIIPKLKSKKEFEGTTARARSGIIAATVKIVKPTDFENQLQVSGSVIGNEEVALCPETSGKVIKINFKEGGRVTKGDLLVKVNDADLQAQLQKAEIRKKLAEDKEYRQKILLSKNGISQETYDDALNELNLVKADIQNIRAQIDKTEIHAPFDGIIGLRYISEGSYITIGTAIASLQSSNPVKIDFSIPERYAGEISIGNMVIVKTASEKNFNARVYAIEPKIDPQTRALQVRATCPNDRGELIAGAYVSITVNLNSIKNALTVPTQALALDISGQQLFLYKNGIAVPRKVESGVRTESEIQIVRGIAPGDTIITSGIMQIRPRVKVKIISIEK